MSPHPVFIYSPDFLHYRFNDHHPFNQQRLLMTMELLQSMNLLDQKHIVAPQPATIDDISCVHDEAYIEAVQHWSSSPDKISGKNSVRFGLGSEDTPIFPKMHEAALLIAGASMLGVDLIMQNKATYALNLGGGLHHAMPAKASGFCVYNDCSVAIHHAQHTYGLKVLYVDTDAHHGDGVQYMFDHHPDVFTFSIHETGKFLFPGTGHVDERGFDAGYGTCLNLPMEPFTEDDSWLACFEEALTAICRYFKPDLIISQHGCDAHYYDPLTHLSLSQKAYAHMPVLLKRAADTYAAGRWLALGGGGYDIYRVVPRAWTMLWMAMNDIPIEQQHIHPDWLNKWQASSKYELPSFLLDRNEDLPHIPRRVEIEERNKQIKDRALNVIRSIE